MNVLQKSTCLLLCCIRYSICSDYFLLQTSAAFKHSAAYILLHTFYCIHPHLNSSAAYIHSFAYVCCIHLLHTRKCGISPRGMQEVEGKERGLPLPEQRPRVWSQQGVAWSPGRVGSQPGREGRRKCRQHTTRRTSNNYDNNIIGS